MSRLCFTKYANRPNKNTTIGCGPIQTAPQHLVRHFIVKIRIFIFRQGDDSGRFHFPFPEIFSKKIEKKFDGAAVPSYSVPVMNTNIDSLTKKHTAFSSFSDLVSSKGGYQPSFYLSGKSAEDQAELVFLADAFDHFCRLSGENRRAYRADFENTEWCNVNVRRDKGFDPVRFLMPDNA